MRNRKHPLPQVLNEVRMTGEEAKANEMPADNHQFLGELALLIETVQQHPYSRKKAEAAMLPPMEASAASIPFNHPDWLFEMKLDGIRSQLMTAKSSSAIKPQLKSEAPLPQHVAAFLEEAFEQWPVQAVLDGIVVLPENNAEANRDNLECPVIFYAFDLLWLEGFDLTQLPLLHRKQILQQVLPESGCLRISDHIDEWGEDFYHLALSGRRSGIFARYKFGAYQPGRVSGDWLSIDLAYDDVPVESSYPEGLPADEEVKETESKDMEVDGHLLRLLKPGSYFHKEERVSKKDVINYYLDISENLLPYLADRPFMLDQPGKHLLNDLHTEKWINIFEQEDEIDGRSRFYAIASGKASLAFLINRGHYTFPTWNSRVNSLAYPDWCVLTVECRQSFEKVIETATVLRQVLRSFDIPSYPKTAANGLEVFIPLGAKYNFEQSGQLAEMLVSLIAEEIPGVQSAKSKNRSATVQVTVGHSLNRPKAALPAPYSLLSSNGIALSAPLLWDEVVPGLVPEAFHLKNMAERLQSKGDIFYPILGKGVDLNHLLKGLSSLVG
ncbi:MAG: hypothetical protein ACO1OO_01965 [Flavisolibacter sp.]